MTVGTEGAVLIEVSRSGGVTGMVRRGVVDTDGCDDADVWVALAVRARPVPPAAPEPAPVRDGFTWTIRVGTEQTVIGDGALTGALRELAERTLREGRPPRR
ncbi:hypothetical protein RHODO2019_07780 [Rhodococcus antarcticus]|uniref:Uncharacterized protein n=1 Tax=Rhodococcus antarcticus TaxID=2987751 RepID=A0ABY6P3R6_9NOCA|nr:protealysin inhibitor emfourin [Rhodococcus antarcticus]UZJ26292.1 hypothetical protein RHODO2019_07780 [Rhodococcus antarcticus]